MKGWTCPSCRGICNCSFWWWVFPFSESTDQTDSGAQVAFPGSRFLDLLRLLRHDPSISATTGANSSSSSIRFAALFFSSHPNVVSSSVFSFLAHDRRSPSTTGASSITDKKSVDCFFMPPQVCLAPWLSSQSIQKAAKRPLLTPPCSHRFLQSLEHHGPRHESSVVTRESTTLVLANSSDEPCRNEVRVVTFIFYGLAYS